MHLLIKTVKILVVCFGITLICCRSVKTEPSERPNVLWIFVEDISPDLGTYGNELVHTPNLDHMADNGIKFLNTIMPSPVCSPSRSAIITGMMSTTLGTHNHHSSRTNETAIVLPDDVTTVPELFKEAGYFTFNKGKDDYNFWYDRKDLYQGPYAEHPLYGKSGRQFDWKDRKDKSQPFFGQIQLKGSKHIFNEKFKSMEKDTIDRSKIELPPYYPDIPIIREEWGQYLETMQITDNEVGEIIKSLENDGLLANTVIFFFSDHGMRMLRHKQFLYEGGIKVPLIVMWKGKASPISPGSVDNDLVSGFDIGVTSLQLAGIEIPAYMEGENLFDDSTSAHEYIISTRDRCDFTIDRIRSVRSKQYKYIKNYFPMRSYMQANYRDEWSSTKALRLLYQQGKLDSVQSRIFQSTRPEEELYDLLIDPHELNNLVAIEGYQDVLQEHRAVLKEWILETDDQGQYPEDEANLKYMLGIWGDQAVNEEYGVLRAKYTDYGGSIAAKRSQSFKLVEE